MRLKSRVSHAAILIDGTPLTLDVVPDGLFDLLERSLPSPPSPLVASAGASDVSIVRAIESLSADSRRLLLADLAYSNEHVWVREPDDEPDDDSDLASRIGLLQVHGNLKDAMIYLASAHAGATHG